METHNQTHPSATQLAALALGKLKPDSALTLQEHVSSCSSCASFVTDTPRDAMIALLRQASFASRTADQSTPGLQDAATLDGIPRAAEPPVPTAAHVEPPRQNSQVAGVSASDGAAGNLADAEIPRPLREQTKYRIRRLLGRGGMGSVYEAHHVRMDRRVAIKIINPSLVDHPEALDRFDQEVKSAAKLDHPNVARAYDADEFGSVRVLVMEFVPGQSLEKFLAQRKRLSVMEACRLVRQAMVGLEHAHQRGMVHRDLKPQNLMLTPEGKVKILDFGLAKVASERRGAAGLTRENALMGTPLYLAPEQALDAAKADIRADIYSLGCTLYCLLAGEPPFNGDTEMKVLVAHQNDAPRPLCEVRQDVPQELSDLVDRMLAKKPDNRPQTPTEAARALLPFAKSENAVVGEPAPHALAFLDAPSEALARPALKSLASRSKPAGFGFWSFTSGGLLLAMLFAAWAAGVFSVRTPEGTVIVENVPHDAEVLVDGHTITLSRNGETVTIAPVSQGDHHLKLMQGGKEIWTSDVAVNVGGQQVRIKYEHRGKDAQADLKPAAPTNGEPTRRTLGANERFSDVEIVHGATWKVDDDGDLVKSGGPAEGAFIIFGNPAWSRYNVEFKAKVTKGLEEFVQNRNAFNFHFHVKDSANRRFFTAGGDKNADGYDINCIVNGRFDDERRDFHRGAAILQDRWYDARIEIRGANAKSAVDGVVRSEISDERLTKGRIGLGSTGTDVRFRDIRVTDEDGKEIWKGPPKLLSRPKDAAAADLLRAGTVWTGTRSYRNGVYSGNSVTYELHVRERNGAKFEGHVFDNGPRRNRAEVEGKVDGNHVDWREQSGHNKAAVLTIQGTLDNSGEAIHLTLRGDYGGGLTNEGDGELKLLKGTEAQPPAAQPLRPDDANAPGQVRGNFIVLFAK